MLTVLLGFILLALVIAAMSIGVIMGRKPISGSCGGVGAALGEKNYECDICGGDPNKCEEQLEQQENLERKESMQMDEHLSYDATKKDDSNR